MKGRTPLPLTWEPACRIWWRRAAAAMCGNPSTRRSFFCEAAVPKDGGLLLTEADAKALAQRSAMRYDRGGDAMW